MTNEYFSKVSASRLQELGEGARKIYEAIKGKPGIDLQELTQKFDLSLTTVRYHVNNLKRERLISEVPHGSKKHLFVAGNHDYSLNFEIVKFAGERERQIATLLLQRPLTATDITKRIGGPFSTVCFRLKQLKKEGIVSMTVQGRRCIYSLVKPEMVRKALSFYSGAEPTEASSKA